MNELELAGPSGVAPIDVEAVVARQMRSRSANTIRAYARWVALMTGRCGPPPWEPLQLAAFLASLDDPDRQADSPTGKPGRLAVSTIRQAAAAIGFAQRLAAGPAITGHIEVTGVLDGIARTRDDRVTSAPPVTTTQIARICAAIDGADVTDIHDKALLLVAFAGGFRRSELAGLKTEDIAIEPDLTFMAVHLRSSKTDQTGKGHDRWIHAGEDVVTCPVRALSAWREHVPDVGPQYRTIRHGRIQAAITVEQIWRIVRRRAATAGITGITPHSFRAGMATALAQADVPERDIARHGAWSPDSTVIRRYIHTGRGALDSPSRRLNL